VTDRAAGERMRMSIQNISNMRSIDPAKTKAQAQKADVLTRGTSFSDILKGEQQKCPYNHLAKNNMIKYNGVIFMCDYDTNSICLGDMTEPKKVLNISLPSGGSLRVNVDSVGGLSKAAGMFSPEDLNAILRAISQYNHFTSKLNEIEEEEIETVENLTKCDEKAEEQE
jgi:hypothetical protein